MAKRLTARSIEQVKPRESQAGKPIRTEIPDAHRPGLYLVIQPTGKRSWAVRYRFRGQPRKVTLEGFPSLSTARRLAQAELDKVAEGRDPAAEKRDAKKAARNKPHGDSDLFADVSRRFIERYAKPKNRSWKETARLLGLRPDSEKPSLLVSIRGGVADKWGRRRAQEIRKRDLLDLLDGIVDRGAGILANRTLAALRKLFNWCVERDIIEASPCATVRPPAPTRARDRVLIDDELRWFWQACGAIGFPFGDAAKLLLLTGQRLNEVGKSRYAELNLEAREWTIPAERAKNNEPNIVPLSESALAIIDHLPRVKSKPGYLFTLNGQTASSGWSRAKTKLDRLMLDEALKAGVAEVTIKHWTFHDLRRTAASGMARLGVPLPVIEKVLNHRSGSFAGVVGVYQRHNFADEKRRALETWANFVLSVASNQPFNSVVELRAAQ